MNYDTLELTLKTLNYPNGGNFRRVETKRTQNGFSHALKDLHTNQFVRNQYGEIRYFSCEQITKLMM
jgi:hypothetical protein